MIRLLLSRAVKSAGSCVRPGGDRTGIRNQAVAAETDEEAGFVFAGEFMLPDAHHAPAGAAWIGQPCQKLGVRKIPVILLLTSKIVIAGYRR